MLLATMATTHITVYNHPVTSATAAIIEADANASLATSVDDVMEKMAELRAAKRARTEADQAVASIQLRQRELELRLATAKSDQNRCQTEEWYRAGELAHSCNEWLACNQVD